MRRCWLKGQTGDALHAVLCAAGFNLRWLLRAIVRLGLRAVFLVLARLLALPRVDEQPPSALSERHGHARLERLTASIQAVFRRANRILQV